MTGVLLDSVSHIEENTNETINKMATTEFAVALITGMLVFAIGGSFPKGPAVVQNILKHEVVQWVLCYVFVYSVAAKKDMKMAVVITAILYAMQRFLH